MAENEQIKKVQEELKGANQIEAHRSYATTIHLQGSGTDFTLLFAETRQVENPGKELVIVQGAAAQKITNIVTMSPQTMKDLSILLRDAVAGYEAEFGVMTTPFTKRREAEAAAKKK